MEMVTVCWELRNQDLGTALPNSLNPRAVPTVAIDASGRCTVTLVFVGYVDIDEQQGQRRDLDGGRVRSHLQAAREAPAVREWLRLQAEARAAQEVAATAAGRAAEAEAAWRRAVEENDGTAAKLAATRRKAAEAAADAAGAAEIHRQKFAAARPAAEAACRAARASAWDGDRARILAKREALGAKLTEAVARLMPELLDCWLDRKMAENFYSHQSSDDLAARSLLAQVAAEGAA